MTDPVCGMKVPADGPHRSLHGGVEYRFCSPRCLAKFEAEPERYLGAAADAREAPAEAGALYTCPMHPEVRQVGPGSCPKCGMALEPLEVTADEGPNHELVDMTRRFWVSLALTVPVLALAMGEMLAPRLVAALGPAAWLWSQLVLSTPVVLWGGWPFFVRGWQ